MQTWNAPHGEWAELLVECAFDGTPAPPNTTGWDVRADGERLQVKSTAAAKLGTFSGFRSGEFDAAVFIRFSPTDLSADWARKVNRDEVLHATKRADYRNADTIRVTWAGDAGTDITERIRTAEDQIDDWLASRR